jgi:hypothetical protein
MANYNWIGSEFIEGGIFERFPELTPYIDDNYYDNETHSQLLVIGESNYFNSKDAEISCFLNADDWYKNAPKELLIPNVLEKKVNNDGKITAPQLKGLYHTLTKVLNRKLKENDRYSDVAFYNYFLRPAYDDGQNNGFGKKGYYQDIDGEVAFSAFCGILKEIKPNLVIFATKIGFDKMEYFRKKTKIDFGNIVIKRVAHPSCNWWNVYGKQDFENLLIKHWVKKFQKLKTINSELIKKFNVDENQECFFDGKGNYLSCLEFRVKDSTFCCETGVNINDNNFWTCFYKTENSKEIPALERKGYKFTPEFSNETIVAAIEKQIREIIVEISKT